MEQMVILSAPWVVPVGAPVIQDGSVAVNDGRIVDIGSRSALGKKYPQSLEKWYAGVLMPGLVNAHMHLELSHLATRIESLPDQNFTDWIDTLIRARTQHSVYREEIVAAFTAALDEQYAAGVALIGDIGNEYYQELHRDNGDSRPRIVRMLEFLGPNRKACRIVLEKLKGLDERIAATAHAPYSTPPALLWSLKARCSRFRHVFSIHAGECSEERDFISSGSGAFRQFLEKKKSWDGVFPFAASGYSGVIEYFDQLGILDSKTLLVHCVHVSQNELHLIKKRGSRICLCPGSNQSLSVGLAPVAEMIALGLQPALGTDSPASNKSVDIWREMQLLMCTHSGLNANDILAMATTGGARALASDDDFGSLAIGKKAHFIHVTSSALHGCHDRETLIDILVSHGKPEKIEWVATSRD